MKDKFTSYYSNEKRIEELSDYVHLNFRLIMTKMQSEMRRKLDIEPNKTNEGGYYSLMCSLQGRLFNEMVYSLCGICQGLDMKFTDVIPENTVRILLELMANENPLKGKHREGMVSQEAFNQYYLKEIDDLRKNLEALPK